MLRPFSGPHPDHSVAPDYDALNRHPSDNEYLHYINHKLSYGNSLLEKIVQRLTFIAVVIGGGVVVLYWWLR